jgi:hypothetical protein
MRRPLNCLTAVSSSRLPSKIKSYLIFNTYNNSRWENFIFAAYTVDGERNFLRNRGNSVGRKSVVGIATRYGLDGPGIESRWGRDFRHPSRPALGLTQSPIRWVTGIFPGGKAARAWHWPPTAI